MTTLEENITVRYELKAGLCPLSYALHCILRETFSDSGISPVSYKAFIDDRNTKYVIECVGRIHNMEFSTVKFHKTVLNVKKSLEKGGGYYNLILKDMAMAHKGIMNE